MPSNPTLGGSDHVQSLHKAVTQKLLQSEKKLAALLSRVLLKDVNKQQYSSNSCISRPQGLIMGKETRVVSPVSLLSGEGKAQV